MLAIDARMAYLNDHYARVRLKHALASANQLRRWLGYLADDPRYRFVSDQADLMYRRVERLARGLDLRRRTSAPDEGGAD